MKVERWKPIPQCPGYEASSLGRVRSFRRTKSGHVLKPSTHPCGGYLVVTIRFDGGGQRNETVNRLVLYAFRGPRPAGMVSRHLNGDPIDNRLVNLAWGTPRENNLDRVAHGRDPNAVKTACPRGHPYDQRQTAGKHRYRACLRCKREWGKRRRAELRSLGLNSRGRPVGSSAGPRTTKLP